MVIYNAEELKWLWTKQTQSLHVRLVLPNVSLELHSVQPMNMYTPITDRHTTTTMMILLEYDIWHAYGH